MRTTMFGVRGFAVLFLVGLVLSFSAGFVGGAACDSKCATYGKDYAQTWRYWYAEVGYTCYKSTGENFSYIGNDTVGKTCCRTGTAGECKNTTLLSMGTTKQVEVFLLCTRLCTSGCSGTLRTEPAEGGTLDGTTMIAHNLCDTTGS